MTYLGDSLSDWSDRWALVLAHSLWVGSLLAGLVAVLLRRIGGDRPDLRGAVAYAAMLLVLVGSLSASALHEAEINVWGRRQQRASPTSSDTGSTDRRGTISSADVTERDRAERETARANPAEPIPAVVSWRRLVVGLWLLGAATMLLRVGRSHATARGLVRRATGTPSPELVQLLDEMRRIINVTKRVTLKVSNEIASPLVYGFISPVILIPSSLATGVPTETLRVVLAHELWHLQRGDLFRGLGQRLVESLFFYHPGVWWLSWQVDREREAACDAAATRAIGRPRDVAHALLDAAEISLVRPVAGLAFARGNLSERIERLLQPQQRPRLRISWGGLLGLTAVGLVALAALTIGARMVAHEVTVALTPVERLAAIEKAMAAAEPDDSPKIDPRTGRVADEVPRYQVSGRFVPPEGESLPRWSGVRIDRRGGTGQLTIGNDGRFESELPAGATFYFTPGVDGYAPTRYGPYRATTGPLQLGDLQLERGFSSWLLVTDVDGAPLEGVNVASAVHWTRWEQSATGQHLTELQGRVSDSDGVIHLETLADRPLDLTLQKPGYQRLQREATFEPGGQVTWRLAPSAPITGRFVDTAGAPIEGVELYCVRSEGDSLGQGDPRDDFLSRLDDSSIRGTTPIAVSGEQGHFEISSPKENATYWLMALHKDHAPTMINRVRASQALDATVMPPPLQVRGRLEGDRSSLCEEPSDCRIWYTNPIRYDGHSDSTQFKVPVEDDGQFVLRQLLPGTITLNLGKQTIHRAITGPMDDLVIDLDNLAEWDEQQHRTVRVRIAADGGQPVRGTVQLSWRLPEQPEVGNQQKNELLEMPTGAPVVEFRAPVGAEMWFSDYGLVGAYAEQQQLGVLPPGEGPYELSVEVQPAGLVTGRVVDAQGNPLRNSTVTVRRVEHHLKQEDDELTADGRFSVGNLPLGDNFYQCEARVNGTWRFATTEPFQLTEVKPIHEATLTVSDPVYLTGRLLDHRGQPAAAHRITMSRVTHNRSYSTGLGQLDDEGRFRIAVSPDDDAERHQITIKHGGGSTGVTLTYEPGAWNSKRDFGTVQLAPGATVRGQVVLAGAVPLAGVPVSLLPVDWDQAAYRESLHQVTDVDGRFEIDGVEHVPQAISVAFGRREVLEVTPPALRSSDQWDNPRFVVEPDAKLVEVRFVVAPEQ